MSNDNNCASDLLEDTPAYRTYFIHFCIAGHVSFYVLIQNLFIFIPNIPYNNGMGVIIFQLITKIQMDISTTPPEHINCAPDSSKPRNNKAFLKIASRCSYCNCSITICINNHPTHSYLIVLNLYRSFTISHSILYGIHFVCIVFSACFIYVWVGIVCVFFCLFHNTLRC